MGKSSKHKFKKVSFKLSYAEYDYLQKCIALEKTTANKFIKHYIREGFEAMKTRVSDWDNQKQPKNQLLLFDFNDAPQQSSMLEETEFLYTDQETKDV